MATERKFTSGEVAKLVGLSERILRNFAETLILNPKVEKFGERRIRRFYNFSDAVEAAVLRELSGLKVSASIMRIALEKLRKKGGIDDGLCLLLISQEKAEVLLGSDLVGSNGIVAIKARLGSLNALDGVNRSEERIFLDAVATIGDRVLAKRKATIIVNVTDLKDEIEKKLDAMEKKRAEE